MPEPFRYDVWSALLADVVTPEGKVDYARLAEHRGLLERVVAELGAASPESDPGRFPSEEDRLAYWLNAYNAFTLHAIIAEYPITSVWKTRDGQFFQRRRHVAGGRAISLDDIEHEILRGQFAEPRIHFAINCGSNGCPPMRPAAYEGARLRETLRVVHHQRLAPGLVRALLARRPRPGARDARARRELEVLRRRADAPRRGDHARDPLRARAWLPRPGHHLLERRQGRAPDRHPGERRAQRGRAQLLDLPRARCGAAAAARESAARGLGRGAPGAYLPGLQGALPRRLGRRPALRPRPRGRLPRPRHRLRALLSGADHEGPFPRLPVRRRDRGAALRPRARRDRPAGRVPELPQLPPLGGRGARPRGAGAWRDELPDVPPAPRGAGGAGVRTVAPLT